MRFTLRSLLTLSRSLRQRVISRFNSVSAVELSFFGRGRFNAMPGTPGRIVNRVKAQESVILELLNGEMLRTSPQSTHGHHHHASNCSHNGLCSSVCDFSERDVENDQTTASFAYVAAQGVVCPFGNPRGVPKGRG